MLTSMTQYGTNLYRPGALNLPIRMNNILSMASSFDFVEIITWVNPSLSQSTCNPANRPSRTMDQKATTSAMSGPSHPTHPWSTANHKPTSHTPPGNPSWNPSLARTKPVGAWHHPQAQQPSDQCGTKLYCKAPLAAAPLNPPAGARARTRSAGPSFYQQAHPGTKFVRQATAKSSQPWAWIRGWTSDHPREYKLDPSCSSCWTRPGQLSWVQQAVNASLQVARRVCTTWITRSSDWVRAVVAQVAHEREDWAKEVYEWEMNACGMIYDWDEVHAASCTILIYCMPGRKVASWKKTAWLDWQTVQ